VNPVDTVVFDLGGVLIQWDREHLYRELIPDPGRRRWFLEEVCSPAWNLEQDRGRSWEAGIAELAARFPAEEALIRAYRERWEEMVPGPLEGTVALLERLAARGIPLYALTNFNDETLALCKARFPFFARFRGLTVSAEEGLVKPDPALYRRMIDRFGLEPAQTLFIDDVPENVEAARRLGFRGHRFLDPATLEQDLEGLGLL
jgi:2-haloacid dehalogenase